MRSRRTASNAFTLALLGSATFIVATTYAQQASPQMSFFITSAGSGKGEVLAGERRPSEVSLARELAWPQTRDVLFEERRFGSEISAVAGGLPCVEIVGE